MEAQNDWSKTEGDGVDVVSIKTCHAKEKRF
jgi:hypothetical protein